MPEMTNNYSQTMQQIQMQFSVQVARNVYAVFANYINSWKLTYLPEALVIKRKKKILSFVFKCGKQKFGLSLMLVLLELPPKIEYITFLLSFLPENICICWRNVVLKYSTVIKTGLLSLKNALMLNYRNIRTTWRRKSKSGLPQVYTSCNIKSFFRN